MPYDLFLSRRGSVADIASEVTDVLRNEGYKVFVQNYDMPIGSSFVQAMHDGIKESRDLIVLYTADYEASEWTRREFTSFEADKASGDQQRHVIVLRCEDVSPRGLFADCIFQDLVGVDEPEGRKRRIIAAAERKTQAAPRPPRPFIGVPPRVASFTGRAADLDRIDALLMGKDRAVITQAVGRAALQGLGGIGKTSLANEYAHRYRDLYSGVAWCLADSSTNLKDCLARLAAPLNVKIEDDTTSESAARSVLNRLSEQRATWLLVYDNVNSPDQIRELLPSAGARVLITSRFSDWREWAAEIPLDVLPVDEAIEFLQARADRRDPTNAKTLVDALGALPLALDHAAAYCKRALMGFAEYAAKATELIAISPRGTVYPQSVAATFNLAIREVADKDSAVSLVIDMLAFCAPSSIPTHIIKNAVEQADRAIATLAELSLIKHDSFGAGTPAIAIHRLVQAVARQRARANGTAKAAMEALELALSKGLPPEQSKRRAFAQIGPVLRLFAHSQSLLRHQVAWLADEYDGHAEKLEEFAARFEAHGVSDKAAQCREKAARFRCFRTISRRPFFRQDA